VILPILATTATADPGSIAGHFTYIDWIVLVGYLIVTTVIGGALAGRQATIRDFFLGGRKLPWFAVSGSIIATEISAVTFVGVPAIMFATSGNFTYLQLGLIGNILARIIVGFVFVPAYYKREIYSPYDYMGNQLGGHARTMTTCLFTLGGMLAQGARVYLTAVVLELVMAGPLGRLQAVTGIGTLTWAIWIIGFVAILWTIMGGITTVIWTDVILFLVFFLGGFVALGFVIAGLPGGILEGITFIFREGAAVKEAGPWGKLTFFDFDPSPTKAFTIWTAAIAASWGGLAAYGTDQLLAQRMFCCKGPREARKAIIWSSVGQVITTTMLLVGLGLYVFYQVYPLSGEAAAAVAEKGDRIFPVFILQVLPTGITGLLIAGIFAAAISSLDSILAALSQTTISAFYLPWLDRRRPAPGEGSEEPEAARERSTVRVSRILVIFWGIVLCFMAHVADAASVKFPEILNLALAMAGYASGALLAGFGLAFLRLNIDSRGYMWSAPLSVFMIFAIVWHEPWTHAVCWLGALVLVFAWLWFLMRDAMRVAEMDESPDKMKRVWTLLLRDGPQTLILLAGVAMMLWVNYFGYLGVNLHPETGKVVSYLTIAWPWFVPIGSTVAFVFGFLLARHKERAPELD
jgi:solute:Na+ symporter, SSS family